MPLPVALGGGPSETSRAHTSIRRAVGVGGSSDDPTGIEWLWRECKARGLAAATSAYRRAVLQAFAFLATDALPYYERIYGIPVAPDAEEPDRRAAIAAHEARERGCTGPVLTRALQAIDPRFSLVVTAQDDVVESVIGRYLHVNNLANYSTAYRFTVLFTLGYSGGVPTLDDRRLMDQAADEMRRRIPSWCTFNIVTATGGFFLGKSPLGLTGF